MQLLTSCCHTRHSHRRAALKLVIAALQKGQGGSRARCSLTSSRAHVTACATHPCSNVTMVYAGSSPHAVQDLCYQESQSNYCLSCCTSLAQALQQRMTSTMQDLAGTQDVCSPAVRQALTTQLVLA